MNLYTTTVSCILTMNYEHILNFSTLTIGKCANVIHGSTP
jgi:hypothetical protein